MQSDLASSPRYAFALRVLGHYSSLICDAPPATDPNLGGKLLYAGSLDEDGRALIVAANIAGAASLSVASDPSVQKQAIRDGVIDFLVNSLDEALRILKNEIRKHEPVAVCVSSTPESIEAEMLHRGVLPDLYRPAPQASTEAALVAEALISQTVVAWSVSSAPAKWLPKLDALALDSLSPAETAARRWLRLSPRYLGRLTQGIRLFSSYPASAATFIAGVKSAHLPISIHIQLNSPTGSENFHFPPNPTES